MCSNNGASESIATRHLIAGAVEATHLYALATHAREPLGTCVLRDMREELLRVGEGLAARFVFVPPHAAHIDAAHPARAVAAAVALVADVVPGPALVHVAVHEPRAVEIRPLQTVLVLFAGCLHVAGDTGTGGLVTVEGELAEDSLLLVLAAAGAAAGTLVINPTGRVAVSAVV